MGHWTLESVLHRTAVYDTTELFGNHYIVSFRLRYEPTTFGSYKETPRLSWNEVITMKEHHRAPRTLWEFRTNMYDHNPLSRTFEAWVGRYYHAYNFVKGMAPDLLRGSVRMLDKRGGPVPAGELRTVHGNAQKAAEVRAYIQKRGCMLFIEIDDVPSINIPRGVEHKERLLVFNCGVEGGGPRTQAFQYLDVDSAIPKAQWVRRFELTPPTIGLKTTGFTTGPAPGGVSMRRDRQFLNGDYE